MQEKTMNILYFSPTGSTEKVCRLTAKAWGLGAETDIDLTKYTEDFTQYHFAAEDICIIGVPSFGGRVPAAAIERLKSMQAENTPAILVVTYGNRDYDDTFAELKDTVEKRGFVCVAAIAAVTQHSIMHKIAAGRPDALDEKEIAEFAVQIKKALETQEKPLLAAVPGKRPYKEYGGVPLKPKVTSKCIKCGICAQKCPVQAIPIKAPDTTDMSVCISCMRCIKVCPTNARKLNRLLLFVATNKMMKNCAAPKKNELFL